jgi:signal transduction histidine kinase
METGAGGDLWLAARHDFRTFSQSLLGLASAVGTADAIERQQLEALLKGCSVSLTGMMELLTLLVRIENGSFKRGREHVSVEAVASDTVAELGPLAMGHGCRLGCSGHSGHAVGDGKLVRIAVRGMVLTAIKLRTQGDISICSTAAGEGGAVAFDVSFEGIDPSPGLSRSAFVEVAGLPAEPGKPFVGLGLTLIARLATHLGGVLGLSQVGTGRWVLRLKLLAVPSA